VEQPRAAGGRPSIGIIGAGLIGGAPVYGEDLDADARAALAEASPERPAEFRAA
jgi:hypothetical protein